MSGQADSCESMPKRSKFFDMPTGHSGAGWHAIESFIRCPKEYQFSAVRKIGQHRPFIPGPLSVGLLLHAARAQWLHDERKGELWREAMERYAAKTEAEEGKLSPGSLSAAAGYFAGYSAYWKVRPVTGVLAIEHYMSPRGISQNAPVWAFRTARYDSIEKWRGKTWIGELKSTSDSGNRLTEQYTLHGQLLLQMALWGEEEDDTFGPLEGVLIDPILKRSAGGAGGPRIEIRKSECAAALTWFRKDLKTWLMQAQSVDWDAAPERRPNCMRAYGPCEFRGLCLKGRRGANQFVLENGKALVTWTPKPGQSVPPWE